MKKIFRALVVVVIAVSVFAIALVVGVALHLHTRVARRAALDVTHEALAGAFAGELRIERVNDLGFDGVHDARATMLDPDGVPVIAVEHVDVKLSVVGAALSALESDVVVIESVHVGDANVSVDERPRRGHDENMGLRIANAFAPRKPSAPSSSPSSFRLSIAHIAIDHAWVHGVMSGQSIDADAANVSAALDVTPAGVAVPRVSADVVARAIPRDANPVGRVHGAFAWRDVVLLGASFDGAIGGIATHAVATLDDDRFAAHAQIPDAPADRIRALAPEIAIDRDAEIDANVDGRTNHFGGSAALRVGDAHVVAVGEYENGAIRVRAVGDDLDAHAFVASIGHTNAHADVTVAIADGVTQIIGRMDPRGGSARGVVTIAGDVIGGSVVADVTDARSLLAPFGVTGIEGAGEMHATARGDRARSLVIAGAAGSLANVRAGGVSLGVVELGASADGPLRDPSVDANVYAERIVVPRLDVRSARATAHGRLRDADVTARVTARGPFDVRARVGLRERELSVTNLLIANNGAPIVRGDLSWEDGVAHVKLDARAVDLGELRETLGADIPLDGHASVALDARIAHDRGDGQLVVDVSHIDAGRIHDLDAHAEVSAMGDRWSIVSRAKLGAVGWASFEATDVELHGSPFDPDAWRYATGGAHVDAEAELARLSGLSGDARVSVVAVRRASNDAPDVVIDASVKDLVTPVVDKVDATTHVHVDPRGRLAAHADITRGKEHAIVDGKTTLAWADIVRGRLPSARDLETLPLQVDASIPSHDVSTLCGAFDVRCTGSLDASIHADGTIATPRARATIAFAHFRSSASPFGAPVDGTLDATLDRSHGTARFALRANDKQSIDGNAEVILPSNIAEWRAKVDVRATDMPMRAPPQFTDTDVRARFSGTIAVDGYHRDTRARIDLDAADLRVEQAENDHAKITADYDGQKLSLSTKITAKDGELELHGSTTASWGAKLAPSLDKNTDATFALHAKNFRACTLSPLVPLEVGQIDGRIDADVTASIALARAAVSLQGSARITDGTLRSPAIGELHDIRAHVAMQPDGTLVLDDAHVRGTSGLAKISGKARAPNGAIQSLSVAIDIAQGDAFPLVMSGDRLGTAFGHIDITASPSDGRFNLGVKVPKLHVVMPDTPYRDLETLGPPPKSIVVGIRDRTGKLVPIAFVPPKPEAKTTPVIIAVDLGNDVQVERGDMLRVFVSGHPKIEIGDRTRVTGQVLIPRGTIDIQGKRFTIERGEATFTGDASNPTIFLSATWDAPDGSHVVAQYTGPVQNGKLTLQSDPPHTQDEIVSLLVFGSADGPVSSGGSAASGAATTAVGTGASLATQPINKAISQLTRLDIKTRVDSGSASGSRSEVEVQLARAVSVQIAYVLGLPPPGTDPDRTWLTLLFHFTARWSLDFTMGDHGSSIVEMLWHYRY